MRLVKTLGSSFAALYLVCALLAVFSIGSSEPVIAADAAQSSQPVKVVEVKQVAEPVEQDVGVIEDVANTIPDWVEVMSALFMLAGAITAVTPTPKDNAVLIVVRKFFDILALNVGGAKNAADQGTKNQRR